MKRQVPLEPAAEQVCNSSAKPPLIFTLPPAQGRKVLDDAQKAPVFMHPATVTSCKVSTGKWGEVNVYFISPQQKRTPTSVIFYLHGGGWVYGNFHTHQKLVRELACRTGSVVVFPEYTPAPEAKYPVAIEQCYAVMCRLPKLLAESGCDCDSQHLTVAGDSAGGNLAISMVLLANRRHGPEIHNLLLYYPVTNANFQTPSYREFARDYYLYRDGMIWFWNKYTANPRERRHATASPLLTPLDELKCFPRTLIINAEAEVLRSEGEAFARKLRSAGVKITHARFQGMIHDFVMLHSLDKTQACRGAMDLSTTWLKEGLSK